MEGMRGYTWATFEEKAREMESLSGWPPSRKPLSPNAGRLCREDMAIYGEEPAMDSLSLVVCAQCGRVVKSQALLQHKKLYHTDMMKVSAPRAAPPPLGGIHTIGQSSSAMSTNDSSSGHHGDGVGGVTGFTASQLPSTATGKSNKEYDPNKHCGVWISADSRHCTHSLTCKEHPVSERRKVSGRGRSFDELLEEHKKKKKMRKLEKLRSDADVFLNQASSHTQSPPLRSPNRSSRYDPTSPRSEATGEPTRASPPSTPGSRSEDNDAYPKPLAVCSFGGRSSLGGGLWSFSRRQDGLRSGLAHLSGRSQDYTQTTLHRKHSYNSLLKEKRSRRTYFNLLRHQASEESSTQHPSSLPLPLHPVPLPPTPTQPSSVTSPLYASTILSDITSGRPTSLPSGRSSSTPLYPPLHTPSGLSTPRSSTSLLMSPTLTVAPPPPLANGDLSLDSVETDVEGSLSTGQQSSEMPLPPPPATNKRTGKKKNKKRGRRTREKTQVDSATTATTPLGVGLGVAETQPSPMATTDDRTMLPAVGGVSGVGVVHSGEDVLRTSREQMEIENSNRRVGMSVITPPPLHSGSNSLGSSNPAQPVSETSQTGLVGHGAPTSLPSGVGGGSEVTTPPRRDSGLPLGFGGVVRVKQEPITNHEDEMETTPPPAMYHGRPPVTKPQSVVLNGMVTPPTGSASSSRHPGFGSQTFVINPTGQHSSPSNHPLMTSLSPQFGGLLPIRAGSTLFSTSPGLIHAHQLQMLQQQQQLIQQLRQQQQQHLIQGGGGAATPTPSLSGTGSRTNADPVQNSLGGATAGGGLVMTASGHGFHSFHLGGSESPLRSSSSSGGNRIRAPISHIPSGTPAYQDVRGMPHLSAIGRNELSSQSTNKALIGKQNLNAGASNPRPHFPSQQVT